MEPTNLPLASVAIVPAGFILLGILERWRPLRRPKRAFFPRLVSNVSLTALAFWAGSAVVRPAALGTAVWLQAQGLAWWAWTGLPFWLQLLGGFLLMDLSFYHWHRLNHLRPLLWRFHNIHHVDPDLDVTTSFRFHFGEVLYSTAFRVLQVGLLGIAPITYLVYELLFNLATMFHHSNLRLPVEWERRLNRILVTPRMHGIHHSAVGPETNSNYSVIFSWWDRLHRSIRLNVPQQQVVIGVPGYLLPQDNRLRPLLYFPFQRQRPYWRWPGGKASIRKIEKITDTGFMAE